MRPAAVGRLAIRKTRHFPNTFRQLTNPHGPNNPQAHEDALDWNHFVVKDLNVKSTPDAFTVAVKDNIATATLPTQCASRILANHASPVEATIVRQLREQGALIVGKTNMDEFGMGSHSTNSAHGLIRNPLSAEEDRSAGGSSGGSAVAVQVGDAMIALGTDTGGSIRTPAAYNGIVGYKPSYGMISRYGVIPYANSLDTVGFMAKTPEAIEKVVFESGISQLHDPHDPTSLSTATRKRCLGSTNFDGLGDVGKLTIGLPIDYNIAELDPAIRTSWLQIAEALQAQGAQIIPVSLPTTRQALCAYYVLAPAEASSNLAKYDGVRYGIRGEGSDAQGSTLYAETRGAGFGEEVQRRILLGTYTLCSEAMDNYFVQAQKVRRLVQRDFDRIFKLSNPLYEQEPFDLSDIAESTDMQDKQGPHQVDFLLCPTTPTLPPRLSDLRGRSSVDAYTNDVFTVPASLAGLPAVSVPVAVKGSKFPAGLQVIGQYWDDRRVLEMARRVMDAAAV